MQIKPHDGLNDDSRNCHRFAPPLGGETMFLKTVQRTGAGGPSRGRVHRVRTAVDLDNAIDGQPAGPARCGYGRREMGGSGRPPAHLAAPHMLQYRDSVKDIVAGVEIRVLEPA